MMAVLVMMAVVVVAVVRIVGRMDFMAGMAAVIVVVQAKDRRVLAHMPIQRRPRRPGELERDDEYEDQGDKVAHGDILRSWLADGASLGMTGMVVGDAFVGWGFLVDQAGMAKFLMPCLMMAGIMATSMIVAGGLHRLQGLFVGHGSRLAFRRQGLSGPFPGH